MVREMSFESALAFTLTEEGGYSDDKRDRGGQTNYGITQRTLDVFNVTHGLPKESVHDIDRDKAALVYQLNYWTPAHCAAMPDKLGMCVFDFAVNSGVHQALATLQTCLGSGPDGRWGLKTAAVLASYLDKIGLEPLLNSYLDARRDFCQDIVERNPGQHIFLADWEKRVNELQEAIST